jgi:hypothetical protein
VNDHRKALELAIRALHGDTTVKQEALLACEQALHKSPTLHRIAYRSKSLISPLGLERLLEQSKNNNQILQITGCLVHWNDNIVQILEGPPATVLGLSETIRCDHRHENFTLLSSRPINERRFGQWLMANLHVDEEDFMILATNLEGSPDRMERRIANWMKSQ